MASTMGALPMAPPSKSKVLEPNIRKGLIAVSTLAWLSVSTSVVLLLLLSYRIWIWRKKGTFRHNQFIILVFNMLLSNLLQGVAFGLDAQWVKDKRVDVGSTTCWAQGHFIATGDVANGFATFAIAVHTLLLVGWNYSFGVKSFYLFLTVLWLINYAVAIIPVVVHPDNAYASTGIWCWIPAQYKTLRFWCHYFWAYLADFGTIIIYFGAFIMIRSKSSRGVFSPHQTKRAYRIIHVTVVYPIVFCISNLPLVMTRTFALDGHNPSNLKMIIVGAMNTSTGWMNVLLYVYTQRQTFFDNKLPDDISDFNTLSIPFWNNGGSRFGTMTTIEAGRVGKNKSRSRSKSRPSIGSRNQKRLSNESDDELFCNIVKTETTIQISHEPMNQEDLHELHGIKPPRESFDHCHKKPSFSTMRNPSSQFDRWDA